MTTLDPNLRLYLMFALCLGVTVTGLLNTVLKPSWLTRALAGVMGVGVASGTIWVFEPSMTLLTAAAVSVLIAVVQVSRSFPITAIATGFARLFRFERTRWGTLAIVGVAMLIFEFVRFDQHQEEIATTDQQLLQLADYRVPLEENAPVMVVTDQGTRIPMAYCTQYRSTEEMISAEELALNRMPHRNRLIKRGDPDDNCNCHGWVFTGGTYNVRGANVDRILTENQYRKSVSAVPGDLCIYRGVDREVLHTAIIRAVCEDGTVLVEGKWGALGVYLHPADQSCYGEKFEYYHSARKGHLLSGLPPHKDESRVVTAAAR